jgi:hypothetical protein
MTTYIHAAERTHSHNRSHPFIQNKHTGEEEEEQF